MRHPAMRWVLGGLAAVLLVAAIGLAVATRQRSADAAQLRDETAELRDVRTRLRVGEQAASADAAALEQAVVDVRNAFVATGTALDAAVDAHNRAVDVHNTGAELHNQGQLSASRDTYVGDGAAAVAEEAAKVDVAKQALTGLQSAIHELGEQIDD